MVTGSLPFVSILPVTARAMEISARIVPFMGVMVRELKAALYV